MSTAQILFNLYFAFIGAYLSIVLAGLLRQNEGYWKEWMRDLRGRKR